MSQTVYEMFINVLSADDVENATSEMLRIVTWFCGLQEQERKQSLADLVAMYLAAIPSETRYPAFFEKAS